jgi:hypothetical protein
MKLIKYNSNLLCSLVRLDSAKKLMAKNNVDIAIATAEKGLQFEDGRGMGPVRAELQKIVESRTTVQ